MFRMAFFLILKNSYIYAIPCVWGFSDVNVLDVFFSCSVVYICKKGVFINLGNNWENQP